MHSLAASLAPFAMNEQIIGLEFVCIIGSSTVNSLDDLEDRRTRTTTLTPDTEHTDQNETSEKNSTSDAHTKDTVFTAENVNNELRQANAQHPSGLIKFPNHTKKKIFYSKFQKLNISCLLDLIEEKDLDEFKSLINKLECSHNEVGAVSANNVKVYLRFNWYSFNELNSVNNSANFSTLMGATNNFISSNSSTSKMFAPISTAPNGSEFSLKHQQVKLTKGLGLSSSSLQQQQQHSIQNINVQASKTYQHPNMNDTLSTHSSSSTVYNQNFHSHGMENHKYAKMQHKFEYYHLLYPKIYEFKWHLKDEIFQTPALKYRNIRMLHALTVHIREGVKRKHKHCHYEKRKVILNRRTTTTVTCIVDAKPMTGAAKLQSVKTTTTKTVDEDKTILTVDTNKFYTEFIEVIKTLNEKFHKCKLTQMNESFFYLNCIYCDDEKMHANQTDLDGSEHTFKIIVHISKDINKLEKNEPAKSSNRDSDKKTPSPTNSKQNNEGEFLIKMLKI